MLALLGYLGLIFLFFLAGMELDFDTVRGRPLTLAIEGWVLSVAVAFSLAGLLYWMHLVRAPLLVAVALTTTGMGTLMPILRDSRRTGHALWNLRGCGRSHGRIWTDCAAVCADDS
jgi:Kef-type K+ transport system membrane component KefB